MREGFPEQVKIELRAEGLAGVNLRKEHSRQKRYHVGKAYASGSFLKYEELRLKKKRPVCLEFLGKKCYLSLNYLI